MTAGGRGENADLRATIRPLRKFQPHLIATAPSHLRKWRRFPSALPQPANDNGRAGYTTR
jgi:hypothetical protein